MTGRQSLVSGLDGLRTYPNDTYRVHLADSCLPIELEVAILGFAFEDVPYSLPAPKGHMTSLLPDAWPYYTDRVFGENAVKLY